MKGFAGVRQPPNRDPLPLHSNDRNNGVHQDRLVKKLRRKGIQDYEAANAYLEAEYLPEHNRRFAREPVRSEEYHERAPSAARLREVFRLEDGTMDQQRLGGAVPRAFSAAQAAESAIRADTEQGIDL